MQKINVEIKPFLSLTLFFSGAAIVFLIDQFLKYKIRQIGGFYICNHGVSFGIPIYPAIFWLISIVFLILETIYIIILTKNGNTKPFLMLSLALVTGGALSNSFDRYFFGCVFDYIRPGWQILPLFNFADVAIFLVLVSFVLYYSK